MGYVASPYGGGGRRSGFPWGWIALGCGVMVVLLGLCGVGVALFVGRVMKASEPGQEVSRKWFDAVIAGDDAGADRFVVGGDASSYISTLRDRVGQLRSYRLTGASVERVSTAGGPFENKITLDYVVTGDSGTTPITIVVTDASGTYLIAEVE